MRLVASIAICSAIATGTGCNFAVKHPAVTAGIVVGSIGFATCSLTTSIGDEDTSFTESGRAKCYGVTLIAGVGIGLLTQLALWLGYEDEPATKPGQTGGTIEDPTNLEPAPVFQPKDKPKQPTPTPNPEPKTEPVPPAPTPDAPPTTEPAPPPP